MGLRHPAGADPLAARAAEAALAAAGGEEPDVAAVLLALASLRPMAGWEMARAMDAASPGILEEREGYLYPVLSGLERAGRVEARWVEEPGGRPRRVYAAVGSGDGAAGGAAPAAAPLPVPRGPAPRRLLAAARDATRSVKGPFERESARAEVLSHLEASAESYGRLGLDGEAAARAAVRDLGDPWKIRTDLARVHDGRPVVVFPRTLGERLRALAIYDLVPLLVVLALLVLVRWKVVQAYNIPTKSMEPALHGEEAHPDYILVDKTAFLRRRPRRWEMVVFFPPRSAERRWTGDAGRDEDPSAFVKRCTGFGGESLSVREGDLYVGGALERRPLDVEDSMMVPLYDLGRDLRETARWARMAPPAALLLDRTWRAKGGEWTPRGDGFAAAAGAGGEARLAYLGDIVNTYREADGKLEPSYDPVGDAEVRFVAEPLETGALVGADLLEGEARHSLRIGPAGLVLRSGDRTWRSRLARAAAGRPVEVRFRNVDDRLTVRVDGEVVLRVDLPPRVSVPERASAAGVELVAEGGRAGFSGVRIARDIHYLPSGNTSSWQVPEGHFFMMGDNSSRSNDSRAWGAVAGRDLVGVPFAIAFPPSRARWLR